MIVPGYILALLLLCQTPFEALRPLAPCAAGPEVQISSFGEIFDHGGHGGSRLPKIFVLADNSVVIAFRRWQGPLVLAIRRDGATQETRAIPVGPDNAAWKAVHAQEGSRFLVVSPATGPSMAKKAQVSCYDVKTGDTIPTKEVSLPRPSQFPYGNYSLPCDGWCHECWIRNVFPHGNNAYIVEGAYLDILFPIGVPADYPTVDKQFSMIVRDEASPEFRKIRQVRHASATCFSRYAQSDTDGSLHLVWTRRRLFGDRLRYSLNTDGGGWRRPKTLDSAGELKIQDSAICCAGANARVAWQVEGKGVYVRRCLDGQWSPAQLIDDTWSTASLSKQWEWEALAIAAGPDGMLYVVTRAGRDDPRIGIRVGDDDAWSDKMILDSRDGRVYGTDIAVDQGGTAHVVYVKRVGEEEACFYRRIDLNAMKPDDSPLGS